jgi:hypothetical protein
MNKRLLLCLPICLLLAPESLPLGAVADPPEVAPPKQEVRDTGTALPTNDKMVELAKSDPIAFLEACVLRYNREVKGYHLTFHKLERRQGKLQPQEVIEIHFREDPFSVRFDWKQGAGAAKRVLYVKGENNNKLLAKPSGIGSIVGVVERDIDGPDAKQSGRYPISEFGMKAGTMNTIGSMKAAREQNALHVEYLGEQKVKELDNRVCWVLKRSRYAKPEDDGVTEVTLFIDKETWLQTGSILKGAKDQLIAEYWFKDIQFNPEFGPAVFTRDGLKK